MRGGRLANDQTAIIFINWEIMYIKKGYHPWNKNKKLGPHTSEHNEKIAISLRGEKNYLYQKHIPEEVKEKMSIANMGENNINFGKYGKYHPRYKGGEILSNFRHNSKRRELGHNCLNSYFEGSEAHHINVIDVIFIPSEWNHICYHNIWNGKNMEIINAHAYFFLMMQNIKEFGGY